MKVQFDPAHPLQILVTEDDGTVNARTTFHTARLNARFFGYSAAEVTKYETERPHL